MLELTIRLVVSLAIVVGLLLLLARFGARKFRGNAGALVHVVPRQALSRTSSVSVVTVGTRVLVLGTTEQQISVLTELDPDELELDDVADLALVTELEQRDEIVPDEIQPLDAPVEVTTAPRSHRGSHRASPAARSTGSPTGPLAGSVLSPQTWRQAFSAVGPRGSTRRAS